MSLHYWHVPEVWSRRTVAILGNGPSLNQLDVDACRGKALVIAINDALQLAPWADLHWFSELRWWNLRRGEPWYREFRGVRATLENADVCTEEPGIRRLRFAGTFGYCRERDGLCSGEDAGHACINLAVNMCATNIVLLGFDQRVVDGRTHWHGGYPWTRIEDCGRAVPRTAYPLLWRGICENGRSLPYVYNCTPGSELDDIFGPVTDLAMALQ